MKVVVLGGSALSTPVLLDELAKLPMLEPLNVVLAGRSAARLRAVARTVRILHGHTQIDVCTVPIQSKELEANLCDARIVLLQIRVGGIDSRITDELLAERFGTPGDQEIGPVAVSGAWRAWPKVKELLSRISQAAPKSLIVILTSPVGLLVRLGSMTFPELNLVGICELPWTTMLQTCRSFAADVGDVEFSYYGVNHFGCFHCLTFHQRDLVNEYRPKYQEKYPWLRSIDWGIPTPPLQGYLRTRTGRLPAPIHKGARLKALCDYSFPVFERGDAADIRRTLFLRPAPWYSNAIVPLTAMLAGLRRRELVFLSTQSRVMGMNRTERDVVEQPYTVRDGSLVPLESQARPKREMAAAVSQLLEFERCVAPALIRRNLSDLAGALSQHPWLTNTRCATQLAEEMDQLSRQHEP